jgi:hypothetical protein
MKQECIKSNISHKSSNLLIYHQNISGISNRTDELLSEWEFQSPHVRVRCLTEHHLTKAEIIRTSFNCYNLGGYFCRKLKKNMVVQVYLFSKIFNMHLLT